MYFNIINSGIDREKNVKNGDVIIFFQKDAEQIASYYCINVPFYIQSIMGFICYAAYYLFFIKRPLVICVLFIISLFQFLPPYLTKKYFIKNYAAAGQLEGELTQWIISGVSGFFSLKMFNLHNWFLKKYEEKQRKFQKTGMIASATSATQTSIEHMVTFIQQLGFAVIIGFFLVYQWITFEMAVQSISLSTNFYSFVKNFFTIVTQKSLYIEAIKRISEGISRDNSEQDYDNRKETKERLEKAAFSASNRFNIRSLSYRINNKIFFENINYQISGTGIIWIKGPNGIGKSTLLLLLLGELDKNEGEINYGDQKIYRRNAYKCFSYCPQAPVMLNMSSKILIEMFPERKEKILSLLKDFKIENNLLSQPLKDLSGGQRKKIMLSICLSSSNPIYLLDEPESSLDEEAIRILEKYLTELKDKKLIFIISHEKSLEYLAREVIVINEKRQIVKKEEMRN